MTFFNISDSKINFNNFVTFERNIYECNLFSIFYVSNKNNKYIEFHNFISSDNNEIYSNLSNDSCLYKINITLFILLNIFFRLFVTLFII